MRTAGPRLSKRAKKLLAWTTLQGGCFIKEYDWPPKLAKSVPTLVKAGLVSREDKGDERRWRLTDSGIEHGMPLLAPNQRWR